MSNESRRNIDVTLARPRPNARWLCGYARLGTPCQQGPTEGGRCCFSANSKGIEDCQEPSCKLVCANRARCNAGLATSTEEANCRRAVAELGPCIPERSAWFSRHNLAINTAILVGGLLLLCMAIPQSEQVFVPGGLSKKHATILGNQLVSERCRVCHVSPHSEQHAGLDQDDLCLQCHRSHMPDATLRLAHDLSLPQLEFVSQKVPARLPDESSAELPFSHLSTDTKCAMCHVEHHGEDRDIKSIANRRCQACHQERFPSFAMGHPPFQSYPYQTQRSIAFDHAAHSGKHFHQKNETFDCRRCHWNDQQSGPVGSIFRTVGFEKACASCHQEPVRAAAVNGWAILQMPCIAPADRQDASLGLGDWPEEASFDYDGEIGIAMRLLLAGDAEASAALKKLPSSGRIAEVPAADRPAVARSLAHAFRKLINEVAREGQMAWQHRLAMVVHSALGREPNPNEMRLIDELSKGLPPDLFREIERNWFGTSLKFTLQPAGDGRGSPRFTLAGTQSQDSAVDEEELLIPANTSFTGEGADADSVLRNGFESPEIKTDADSTAQERLVWTKLEGSKHVGAGGWFLDRDLLAVRYVSSGHADPVLSAWAELVAIVEKGASSDPGTAWHVPDLLPGSMVPGRCTECHLIRDGTQAQDNWSHWRSVYRPDSARPFTKFDHTPHLTIPSISDCRYCHVLNQVNGRADPAVDTHASRADTNKRETRNALITSLTRPGNSLAAVLENFAASRNADPSHFVSLRTQMQGFLNSEFHSMNLSQCVACHHKGGANDDCTQCHNYHVGSDGFQWSARSRD